MSRISVRIALVLVCLCAWTGIANPCCMVPTSWPHDVDQSRQDGVILFHDGHEELIVRVAPTFPDSVEGPPHIAWIVTVPSRPTGYAERSPDIFSDAQALYDRLERLAERQKPPEPALGRMLGVDAEGMDDKALDISEVIRVGQFEITEVTPTGDGDGPGALNEYLEKNGFPAEDVEELRWFTERDFTFLCIHAFPPEGKSFGANVEMPALQIGFASERPYYPSKYSARQGNFALGLTVITSKPLERSGLRAMRGRLNSHANWDNLFTTTAFEGKLAEAAESLPGASGVKQWHVNALPSHGYNRTDSEGVPAIMKWHDDVFFALGDSDDVPPAWYHGDGPAELSHKVARIPKSVYVVMAIGGAILALVAWRLSRR